MTITVNSLIRLFECSIYFGDGNSLTPYNPVSQKPKQTVLCQLDAGLADCQIADDF